MRILLLLGESGSGKSTIAHSLFVNYNDFCIIKSYTTRFRRHLRDNDHIFVRKNNLLYKMFNERYVASTIIDGEIYCSFPSQFDDDKICIYIVDDKGLLDVINYFGVDSVCAVRLKRNNIDIDKQRASRNLNQVIPDGCENINVVDNNYTVDDCCLRILDVLRNKKQWNVGSSF